METKNKLNAYWHFTIFTMFVLIVSFVPEN